MLMRWGMDGMGKVAGESFNPLQCGISLVADDIHRDIRSDLGAGDQRSRQTEGGRSTGSSDRPKHDQPRARACGVSANPDLTDKIRPN
jgi:hypothetical protein